MEKKIIEEFWEDELCKEKKILRSGMKTFSATKDARNLKTLPIEVSSSKVYFSSQEHLTNGELLEKELTLSDLDVEKYLLPFLRNDEDIEKGIKVCAYDSDENNYSVTFKFSSKFITCRRKIVWWCGYFVI